MKYDSPGRLYRRGTIMVFDDIDLVDIERVPGLFPTAQGRLNRLLDDLDDAWRKEPKPEASDDDK